MYKIKVALLFTVLCSFFAISSETLEKESINLKQNSALQKTLPDDFQSLIVLRKKMLINQSASEDELAKLTEERRYLPSSDAEVESRVKVIQQRVDKDKKDIDDLEAIDNKNDDQLVLLNQLKSYVQEDEYQISRMREERAKAISLDAKIQLLKQHREELFNSIAAIEQKIANLLNLEEERNKFRTLVSVAFCILVAIVIIGFYVIALKKESIAESIFAGEKGIQFVTIFLIVIAIILFGIMGVLESKELSALLGGLSGYILGRVSGAGRDKEATSQPS
ncbi:hypothetical protein [Thalassotalea agarivorans]|nr:hypothetical protein [Thalassotalea agarivorans]